MLAFANKWRFAVEKLPLGGALVLWLCAAFPTAALAQREGPSGPQLSQIAPLAAKPGSEFDLVFQGSDLGSARKVLFGVEGIEFLSFRESEPITETARDNSPEARRRDRNRPRVINRVTARVKVSESVRTGLVDVRLVTDLGITNPRFLIVGQGQQALEKEPNNDASEANPLSPGMGITGLVQTATDVDFFRVEGVKDRKITLVLRSTSVDSRLSPRIEVYDAQGKQVGKSLSLLENDQVISFVPRENGVHQVRVFSQAYLQGGPDCQYHLTHALEPVVEAVFPPMIAPDQAETVTVFGWNLPGGQPVAGDPTQREQAPLTLKPHARETLASNRDPATVRLPRMAILDGWEERIAGPGGDSFPFLVGIAAEKVVVDNGANDTQDRAQTVALPAEIAGWFEKKADRDWFVFAGKKGQVIGLELLGDRLGAAVDLQATVYRKPAAGREPANPLLDLDDNPEILHPQLFFSRTEDPAPALLTLPDDGEYLIRIAQRDSDFAFGPPLRYRLRLGDPKPDFHLVAIAANQAQPGGWNLRPGSTFGVLIFASRRQGFGGPIEITMENLPPGCEAAPITLMGGQRSGMMLIQAGNGAKPSLERVTLVGKATRNGQEIQRRVTTASLVWPHPNPNNNQVVPLLVRLNQGEWVSVRELPSLGATIGERGDEPVVLTPGKTLELKLKVNRSPRFADPCDITIAGSPTQNGFLLRGTLANRPLVLSPGQSELKVLLESRNNQIPPGVYQLSLRVHTSEKDGEQKRSVIDFTEPISVVVAPPRVVDLTANPTPTRWKAGMKGSIGITLNRTAGYEGPVEVELVFPQGREVGKSEPILVAPEQTRVQLPLELEADLPLRPIPLIVRARVKIGPVERTSETRVNLQLTK